MINETILAYVLIVILFGGFFLILKKLKEVRKLAETNVKYIEDKFKEKKETMKQIKLNNNERRQNK